MIRDQAETLIRDLKPKYTSGFTGSLLKNQSRQPQANRTALNLNQSGCWKRSGEFAEEKKSKVTHRPAMLGLTLKKKLNDELVVFISWLYPSLWIFLPYLRKRSFVFQGCIRAAEFSQRQEHYTYLQMSYIMMCTLHPEMPWRAGGTMQPFLSARSDPRKRSSLCCLGFQML